MVRESGNMLVRPPGDPDQSQENEGTALTRSTGPYKKMRVLLTGGLGGTGRSGPLGICEIRVQAERPGFVAEEKLWRDVLQLGDGDLVRFTGGTEKEGPEMVCNGMGKVRRNSNAEKRKRLRNPLVETQTQGSRGELQTLALSKSGRDEIAQGRQSDASEIGRRSPGLFQQKEAYKALALRLLPWCDELDDDSKRKVKDLLMERCKAGESHAIDRGVQDLVVHEEVGD